MMQGPVGSRREQTASRRWRQLGRGAWGSPRGGHKDADHTAEESCTVGTSHLTAGRAEDQSGHGRWCARTGPCASSGSLAEPERAGAREDPREEDQDPGLGQQQGEEPRHRCPRQRVEPGGLRVPPLGSTATWIQSQQSEGEQMSRGQS